MEPSSVPSTKLAAGIIISFILLLYALVRIFTSQRQKLPPEAGGTWPLIGHLHLLCGSKPAHKILGAMADAHGPIFTLKLGMHRAVVVSSWEIAKECFTTNDRIFASRPKLAAAKHMGYNNSMFAFTQYGPFWRHMRKITTLELLTSHRLEQFQSIRASEVMSLIKKLYELYVERRSGEEKALLMDMKTCFKQTTLNIILRIVVGKRLFDDDNEGSGSEQYPKALRDFVELFGIFIPSDSFPFLKLLDLGGYERVMKKTAKVLDEMIHKWLTQHKLRRSCGEIEKEEQDFMDVMMSIIKDGDKELSHHDVDSVIKATCLSMILAGSDTTTTSMTWALSLLVNHQEKLKKAQLELDEQVGRQRRVEESDIKNLIYLQAIIKETMRLYPAAPLSVPHESMEDCTVTGYHIPARTRLIVNLQKLQRDSTVWENPSEFQPERFLTGNHKDFDVKGQSPQLIPFGRGRRMCPGISFSLQIIHLTVANLLHGFKIERPSKELLDMEESVGMTTTRKTPLNVVLTPRHSAQFYEDILQSN